MTTISTPKTDANIQLATTHEPTEIHGTTTPITEHHTMHGTPLLCTPQPHETQANTTHGKHHQTHSARTLLTNPQITITHLTKSTQLQHQSNERTSQILHLFAHFRLKSGISGTSSTLQSQRYSQTHHTLVLPTTNPHLWA
jgi:hypothetical protein